MKWVFILHNSYTVAPLAVTPTLGLCCGVLVDKTISSKNLSLSLRSLLPLSWCCKYRNLHTHTQYNNKHRPFMMMYCGYTDNQQKLTPLHMLHKQSGAWFFNTFWWFLDTYQIYRAIQLQQTQMDVLWQSYKHPYKAERACWMVWKLDDWWDEDSEWSFEHGVGKNQIILQRLANCLTAYPLLSTCCSGGVRRGNREQCR